MNFMCDIFALEVLYIFDAGIQLRLLCYCIIKHTYIDIIMFASIFSNICGKTPADKFRLGVNGQLAVKTLKGYKTFNLKTNRLVNCQQFAMDLGQELFMMFPCQVLRKGDVVFMNDSPVCVLDQEGDLIKVLNYETSKVETMMAERHLIMGRPFYGKVVSLAGDLFGSSKGSNQFFKLMMMSQIMSGKLLFGNQEDRATTANNMFGGFGGSGGMMQMILMSSMMNGGDMPFGDMFGGFLQDDDEADVDVKVPADTQA